MARVRGSGVPRVGSRWDESKGGVNGCQGWRVDRETCKGGRISGVPKVGAIQF